MPKERDKAAADFWRVMKLIIVLAIIFTIGALADLGATGELYLNMIVAVIGGVFISVLLGCGLFAAAFFSDKSGHDQNVTDATKQRGD
jgi:fumarate reductase subunit D